MITATVTIKRPGSPAQQNIDNGGKKNEISSIQPGPTIDQ
jgi:hypothetical protein